MKNKHINNNINQNLINSQIIIANNISHLEKIQDNAIAKSQIINFSKSHKKENLILDQTNNIETKINNRSGYK